MKKIIFVTTNKGKFWSARNQLRDYGIEVMWRPVDIPEPRSFDLEEIAKHKAIYASKIVKEPLITLDAGFYLDSYKNFPGPFTNFALETLGLEGILKLVEGRERTCCFREFLAYIEPGSEPVVFDHEVRGSLSHKPLGTLSEYAWSELFLIYIPEGYNKTLAQMSRKEYEQYWNRTEENSCFKKFGAWFVRR